MNDPQARQALLEGGAKGQGAVPAHRGKRPGALDVRIQRDHRLSGRSFRQRLSGRSTAPGRVQGQPVDRNAPAPRLAPRQQAVANAGLADIGATLSGDGQVDRRLQASRIT